LNIPIAIAAAIITVLILLVFVILPPTVFLDPPAADIGTDFNVTAFFLKPGEKVAVSIMYKADSRIIESRTSTVNPVGVLIFTIVTPDYSTGEYTLTINSSRGEYVRNFVIREKSNISQNNVPLYLPKPSGDILIEPENGEPGTTFKITAKSLKPHTMVEVKVVCCLNKVCTDKKTVYIRKGEQEYTNADGKLVTLITTDRSWPAGYNYYVTVSDYRDAVSGYFYLNTLALCNCQGLNECGYKSCCAPNFNLPSLSGKSVYLCNEYNIGISPLPVIWINFWNTSCPGCAEYMKIIQRIKDTWNDGTLKIFTINCGEDPETVATFLADRGYSFYNNINYPVLFDTDSSVKIRYQPKGVRWSPKFGQVVK